MDLTSAEKAAQQATLAGARSAFNANIAVPLTALAGALKAAKQTPEIQSTIIAFNVPAAALNAAGQSLLRAIAATDALVPTDPQPTVEPAFLKGYFDSCSVAGVCSGWASKTGSLVHILVDNVEVGTVRASQPRPDVAAADINNGPNTGWTFQLPPSITTNVTHSVRAHVGGVFLGGQHAYGTEPIVLGTSFPRFAPDMSTDAGIQRGFDHANVFFGTQPTVNYPTKWVNGMLEVPIVPGLNAGPGIGGTGCSWHGWFPQPMPDELWAEYDFIIGTNVAAGITEAGVKLPGIAGAWEQSGQWAEAPAYGWFSARLWHRAPNAQGQCELAGYVYSAQEMDLAAASPDEHRIIPTGKMLTPGVKYKLGQHLKYNTQNADGTWNSDGVFEILCDGVVVFSDKKYKLRGDARATFQEFFVNIFHGGSLPPSQRIDYYIGNIVVDDQPLTQVTTYPAWRATAPIGQLMDIPGSSPAVLGNNVRAIVDTLRTIFDGSFSGVYNDRVLGAMYSAASSGHEVGAQNGVHGINLMADAPAWRTLRAPTGDRTPTDSDPYWSDGRPVGSHLYYTGQVIHNAQGTTLVRTTSLAGNYSNNPSSPQNTDAFNIERNDWDLNGGDWQPPNQRPSKEHAVALDARTNKIYKMDQDGHLEVLDCNTRRWSLLRTDVYYGWAGAVIDPATDELLYDEGNYNGAGGSWFTGYNVTTGVQTRHDYTWEGVPNPSNAQWRSMIIQERNRAIYVLGHVGQLCRLDLVTWKMKQVATLPLPRTPYNRIEDYPTLGGLVYMDSFDSNMRFYATE